MELSDKLKFPSPKRFNTKLSTVRSIKEKKREIPHAICIKGELGTGKKRLLSELKYIAELNEINIIELKNFDNKSLNLFYEELKDLSDKTIIICKDLGLLVNNISAARIINQIQKIISRIKISKNLSGLKPLPSIVFAFSCQNNELSKITSVIAFCCSS